MNNRQFAFSSVDALIEELRPIANRSTRRTREIADILAAEFGMSRGWNVSNSPFTLSSLARRRVVEFDEVPGVFSGNTEALDHHYYYRIGKRPAALAAHLYGWPEVRPSVEAICEQYGLMYEHVTNFPSWWYLGRTELIVYRAAEDW